jgi:signal transduction histidine kinase/CheY-like chemotaxis protein
MADEKIIIVDDEADVLELCERILIDKGYQVTTVSDGNEAIKLAGTEQFDLLLSDIRMPGMDGLEIVQAITGVDRSVVCVLMTGYSTMDMVIEALKLGVDEFILKPFSPDELVLVVTKALEKEQLRQENFRLRSLIPLFELNKTLLGTVEIDEVLQRMSEIAQKETNADRARLYTFEQGEIHHFPTVPAGSEHDPDRPAYDRLARLLFDHADQVTLTIDTVRDEAHRALLNDLNAQAIIATPLKSQKQYLGGLILVRNTDDFAPSDSEFLTVLASQAGIALENARLFTEIQAAYKELQTLDHIKSEFINIAAHELRTPLAILVGYTTVLEEELEGTQRDYLTNIMRNALRLRSLIDDMLNLQYLESGMAALSQDEVDLSELVQEAIQDMSLMAAEKKLNVKIDIPPDYPELIVDRYKLDLIIVNLLHNAIKFTPEGGQVTFKATANRQRTTISINNTNTLIPPEELTRIFDRFYQVESSLTRQHGGIGLGLSIVRGMVEVCGGNIQVDSQAETGTTFTFSLPLDNSGLEQQIVKL